MTDTKTKYGVIHHGGPCKDDYENITGYDQPGTGAPAVRLQGPAMRAFKAAEKRASRSGKPIILTGSSRSCETQWKLWRSDPNRFAHPDTSLHCRALAIDVSTGQGRFRLWRIKKALTAEGWNRVRPDDEPWHWSYVLTA